jgi:hypothetical protein
MLRTSDRPSFLRFGTSPNQRPAKMARTAEAGRAFNDASQRDRSRGGQQNREIMLGKRRGCGQRMYVACLDALSASPPVSLGCTRMRRIRAARRGGLVGLGLWRSVAQVTRAAAGTRGCAGRFPLPAEALPGDAAAPRTATIYIQVQCTRLTAAKSCRKVSGRAHVNPETSCRFFRCARPRTRRASPRARAVRSVRRPRP